MRAKLFLGRDPDILKAYRAVITSTEGKCKYGNGFIRHGLDRKGECMEEWQDELYFKVNLKT